MKILLAADLHIGRGSTRVPTAHGDRGLSGAAAWGRIVDEATAQRVDLLCLVGDVADESNRFWEAIGPLEHGIHRLRQAGMRTLAVAGNHDHEVLARLADQLDPKSFTLLGRGGRWQRLPIELDGKTRLVVDGWLLGHIHTPMLRREAPGRPFVLYPGSPQALDPGETGPHGAWLIEIEHGQTTTPQPLPLSTVRYDTLDIDLSGVKAHGAFEAAVLDAIRTHAEAAANESGDCLAHLSLRLHLHGRTDLSSELLTLSSRLTDGLEMTVQQAMVGIEKVLVDTTPDIDLAEHARGNTPPAALARLLLALEEPNPPADVRRLISDAQEQLDQVRRHRDYVAIADTVWADEQTARTTLKKQAQALLGRLLESNGNGINR